MALGNRHPADTKTYEDWSEQAAEYRTRELNNMAAWCEKKAKAALKAGRRRK
jgi:hypothetical protein